MRGCEDLGLPLYKKHVCTVPEPFPGPLTTSFVQVHANELEVSLMWAPATFHVGHVSATWGIAEGEAVASQDHLCGHWEEMNSLEIRTLESEI